MFSASRRILTANTAPRLGSGSTNARRNLSITNASPPRVRPRRALALTGAAFAGSILLGGATIFADSAELDQPELRTASLSSLVRAYAVYTMLSVPKLVDWSPAILNACLATPGLDVPTRAFVRRTFFGHFVGGESALDTVPLLEQFRAKNKGVLLNYSVEVDADAAIGHGNHSDAAESRPHKQLIEEIIRSIDVAADFEDQHGNGSRTGRRTWVALKLTALLPDVTALTRLSLHLLLTRPAPQTPVLFPGSPTSTDLDVLLADTLAHAPPGNSPLTQEDVQVLRALHDDLVRVCVRAQERNVRVVVDAEYSWYQPAIDAYAHALMERFNKVPRASSSSWVSKDSGSSTSTSVQQPLVYNTYQAYLRRTPEFLRDSLARADAGGYALGVKLVRGAYHSYEVAAHNAARVLPPSVFPSSSSSSASVFPDSKSKSDSAASHPHSSSISPDPEPPVWPTKPDTDACFDACAAVLVSRVARSIKGKQERGSATPVPVGVLFGTHNWASCDRVLEGLVGEGVARKEMVEEGGEHESSERGNGKEREVIVLPETVTELVAFGQLLGMSDALTDHIIHRTRSAAPCALKYVPYGALADVMPYLGRRAQENRSVLGDGGARLERKRAGAEIRRRVVGALMGL
ncbi:FAD-linked oxidoreductase [Coniophora puteana RWD-64-598 SS2]|uniref:Proline dehydrogenase n=1 Tax=Coniophora puteana (strain RWD-64-598) TaxID=741705 RepID=A0A5M3N477_CONPW|nr:FAD-linked oxidoreductase [Coniophora puteana RWD-64-598 SS2]EIW86232.1 FAD-linked oxidoreductase [Coniophora puteana RWD-64-598 SS2]